MTASLRDLRLGLRTLRRSPGLTLVCTVALSFGIGLTTLMFSIIYGAMLRGLPYPNGDRIAVVSRANPELRINRSPLLLAEFYDVRASQRSFESLGAYTSGTMNVSGAEKAERYQGSWVTANLFAMTSTAPIVGRAFRDGEDTPGGPKVAMLGYAMWRDRFGKRESVIGTTIRVNGEPYEIIGVMPEDFVFPNGDQLWLPLQRDPLAAPREQGSSVTTVGVLRAGLSIDEANAELSTISKRLAQEYPKSNAGFNLFAGGFVDSFIGPQPRQLLYTMLGAVIFVLLIACTNVANLLLDRAAHRSKEVGVRSALGASRTAIMRVFLSEAAVLAALGTLGGLAVAYVGIELFNRAIIDTQPPFFIVIGLFPPVFAFTTLIALLATVASGLIPALQASRGDIAEILKDESRGASSMRIGRISKSLVVFELALSCALLVAAGLMIKSVLSANSRDTGYATANVFTSRVGFPIAYTDTAAQKQFFEQLVDKVRALPGVQAASVSSGLPAARTGFGGSPFQLEGKTYLKDTDYPNTRTLAVTPTFFETLEIPLRKGRLFTSADRDGSVQVAVVSEKWAKEFLDGADPIGRRVKLGDSRSQEPWATIVGVVPDVFGGDQENPRPAVVYRPFAQSHSSFAYIAARASGAPMSLTEPVRAAVASLNADIPIYWTQSLDQAIAEPLWFVRIFGTMFMIFGVVALFLAAIGLYAVMSFSVSRRTREVGIRMALGASAGDVLRLIMRQGALQVALGLAIGLALAAGISRVMTVVLFDVKPLDPQVFIGVTIVLATTAMIACLLPAKRATRVDPSNAMRDG